MSKATFNILGDIVANDGDRWFESDVMPAMVIGWLAKQDGNIEININSNGGDVAGGLAIANAIKGYTKGKKTCNVLGVAASMASVIACAGDELKMGQGAFLMVHNPWTVTMGNAEELRKDADTLDKMRDSILSFYQSKAYGKSADDLKALMDAETWLSADEAREAGFLVDDYAGEMKAAASLTRRAFAKAPDAAKALVEFHDRKPGAPAEPPAQPEASGSKPTPDADNWENRYRGLSQKFTDLEKKSVGMLAAAEEQHKAALAARDAENAALKTQLEQGAKDLADANAKVSELSAKLEEGAKALQKATDDLAATRDSLTKAEEQVKHLESTRDALTAGVLTPPAVGGSYADKMKSAKTPEEREALRAQKRAGKIK
ncbi:MAG: ATP-dependent Clp protease proteolytic subunit [Kiritimatiellae bacterium]|nr:ATP-dependent Clp protease proteolytic subunit [Kiritimatiellia bacterium]